MMGAAMFNNFCWVFDKKGGAGATKLQSMCFAPLWAWDSWLANSGLGWSYLVELSHFLPENTMLINSYQQPMVSIKRAKKGECFFFLVSFLFPRPTYPGQKDVLSRIYNPKKKIFDDDDEKRKKKEISPKMSWFIYLCYCCI